MVFTDLGSYQKMPKILDILDGLLEAFKRPAKPSDEVESVELPEPDKAVLVDEFGEIPPAEPDGIHVMNPNKKKLPKVKQEKGESDEEEENILDESDMSGDTKNYCRRVPFEIKPREVKPDNQDEAKADIEIDQKLRSNVALKKRAAIQRRPTYQKVKAQCRFCRRTYKVDPGLIPGRIAADDTASFICDNCIPKR